ncbi:MAG: metal ABC transporter ATP-binding protein [Aeromicrobium sp.]|uniref:metal ABC transporter ATP-binding protein n=1 Tax=Aeromicrobium sp. TaxID=1871063 RepID=UPI0039E46B1E
MSIEVTGLTVRYGEVTALDGVDLSIQSGCVCGLIGMNGAGKSTLFKAIMGVVAPDTGDVRIAGLSPAQARRAGVVGHVPQAEDVDWTFPVSVRDVVTMGRYRRTGWTRRPRRADRAVVDEALERVGLADLADRQIGRLSGGQRKRAFVARGLAQEARVLLLDEPFAGVDQSSQETMRLVLRELAADGGTVFVATHDLELLPRLADEAVLLMRRVIVHDDPAVVVRPEHLAEAW